MDTTRREGPLSSPATTAGPENPYYPQAHVGQGDAHPLLGVPAVNQPAPIPAPTPLDVFLYLIGSAVRAAGFIRPCDLSPWQQDDLDTLLRVIETYTGLLKYTGDRR